MHLNKTGILAGLHCEKRLYLSLNRADLAITKKSPLAEAGILVGEQARKEFPGGVLVKRFQHDSDPYAETARLLTNNTVSAIFEAGFYYKNIEVFVDILQRDGRSWNLIEVKSSTSVKDDYIDDATVQYMVLTGAGIAVNRVELMFLNKEFVYRGKQNYAGLFVSEDITERVIAHNDYIADAVKQLRVNISGTEPVRHIDGHCKKPYPCEFKSYCEKQDTKYPVGWLPNAAAVIRKLHDRKIFDIRDIPAYMLNSETHLKVRQVTINGQAELDPAAADILKRLAYPRYYLDFETINHVVPVWPNTRPGQQHPFQWSCHIQHQHTSVGHKDFLDISGSDPRRRFAESLVDNCGTQGPVIVYNQTFEKGIIKTLAAVYPDLSEPLLAINSRVFDLLPVMKKYYYHPAMKGSWSIKSVLSCLVPELSYADLGEVQDGLMAQSAYLEITGGKLSAAQKDSLTADMREYCKLDTYAMLAIIEKVCEKR